MAGEKVFTNIGGILSLKGVREKDGRHITEKDLSWSKCNTIAVDAKGIIQWIGKWDKLPKDFHHAKKIDWEGREVIPAFTECHTHTVFAGDRSKEFEMRNSGASYQEIAKAGGGIISTVSATRKAKEDKLLELAQMRVDRFVEQGVSCIEVKSGYGLKKITEEKMLRVARALKKARIKTTYLGAHAIPPEYKGPHGKSLYLDSLLNRDLPDLVAKNLVDRVDIFVEKNYFDILDADQLVERAKVFGLDFCIHADQLSRTGSSRFGAQKGALSVDHAVELTVKDREVLAKSNTVAVCLPTADIYIHAPYPKAREMIDAGVKVALATDFNPGTSPTQDLSFVGMLARLQLKMSLPESIAAYTYNSASALGLQNELGSIEVGKQADFCVLDMSWKELFYGVGHHKVFRTIRAGKKIY